MIWQGQSDAPTATATDMIEDLDDLPWDGRESLMDLDKYDLAGLGAIMSARGCPFPCTYCASKRIWTRKARFRSPEHVVGEIRYAMEKYGVKQVQFCDDTFTVNKKRVTRICELLDELGGKVRWSCTTRADCMDASLAVRLHRSGCTDASIGVESGSPRILDRIRKSETREDIAKGCRYLQEAGIQFIAFIMIGFPTETEGEAWETLRFAESLGADSLCGSVVTPYPGTELYDWAAEEGRLPENENWSTFYHQSTGMGLWDIQPERGTEIIARWFEAVEKYNHRKTRLARRFMTKVRSDPWGTLHRASSLVWRKICRR